MAEEKPYVSTQSHISLCLSVLILFFWYLRSAASQGPDASSSVGEQGDASAGKEDYANESSKSLMERGERLFALAKYEEAAELLSYAVEKECVPWSTRT
jgi:hypothetical protein